MISMTLQGDGAFLRLLNLDHVEVAEAIAAGLNEAALIGQALIVADTPVQTATLRNSIAVELATPAKLEARIHTGTVPYAAYVEFGTGVYSDFPGASKAAYKVSNLFGRGITATLKGMRPRAMFRKNMTAINTHLDEAVKRHVEGVLRGQ